jgi:hypothetical protein
MSLLINEKYSQKRAIDYVKVRILIGLGFV